MKKLVLLSLYFIVYLLPFSVISQIEKAPPRAEGEGQFNRLIIRGVNLVNGTGSPMQGPCDIVVEKNKITEIKVVGYPGVPIDPNNRPKLNAGDKELDCTGMYMLPGFLNMCINYGLDMVSQPFVTHRQEMA